MSSPVARPQGYLILLILLFAFALPQSARAQRSLNTGFEERSLIAPGQPWGWTVASRGFRAERDTAVAHSGRASLRITHEAGGAPGMAGQYLPVADIRGRQLQLTGWIRTEGVEPGWAGLWVQVDGPGGVLTFDNMADGGASGTTGWTRYETTIEVDSAATSIAVGIVLSGTGTAWFDDLAFIVDGVPLDPSSVPAWIPSTAELAWARKAAIPFATAHPGSGFDDLKPVGRIVGDARIVALGEGTHGTSEFFRFKHRLTEYLANRHGFTVFAIEAGMPEARRVNEYVLTGRGDPRAALAGLGMWIWDTQEVLELIEWMRAFNASGKGRIEFWGFDMQSPSVAMDSIRAFVARADAAYLPILDSAFATVRTARTRGGGGTESWRAAAADVLAHLEKARPGLLRRGLDSTDVAWAVQNARIVLQGAEVWLHGLTSPYRDSVMAANVEWILAHQPPDSRMVVWAHNAHVQRSPTAMGGFLDRALPGRVRIFGQSFNTGTYSAYGPRGQAAYPAEPAPSGSFEHAFHSLGLERFVLDLRPAGRDPQARWLGTDRLFRGIGGVAMDDAFSSTPLARLFDAMIFFDVTRPTSVLPRRQAYAAGALAEGGGTTDGSSSR